MGKGITKEQADRVKDELKRAARTIGIIDVKAKGYKDDILERLVLLLTEQHDAIIKDIDGMMNGNTIKESQDV